jgi:hypothetical protein
MDIEIYSQNAIDAFMGEHFFFNDSVLKRIYEDDGPLALKRFRNRMRRTHPDKNFKKIINVVITDSIRDIILETAGDITAYMRSMGDMIISGGEAFNIHMPYAQRIVTSDIDAKFVPRLAVDTTYFGKLQAIKLVLWDRLGMTAKKLDVRVRDRILNMQQKHPKLFKYLGIGFSTTGPYVTRRYTLMNKKKTSKNNTPSEGDVFIDVELFALDLNLRYFSNETGKIEKTAMGGILDIPFMRPKEFGYEVILSRREGLKYRNKDTGRMITDNRLLVASRLFLIEDIYIMNKLKLRPGKQDMDRRRFTKLAKMFNKNITASESIEQMYARVRPVLNKKMGTPRMKKDGRVPMKKALEINPYKYVGYTSKPSIERLSKQLIHGLKTIQSNVKVNGYANTSGNKRFNLETLKWVNTKNTAYVRNEYNLRPNTVKPVSNMIDIRETLYGYNPVRDAWVPDKLIKKASAIPFVGLKKSPPNKV